MKNRAKFRLVVIITFIVVVLAVFVSTGWAGSCYKVVVGNLKMGDRSFVKSELEQVMVDIYAPKSMEQFIQSYTEHNGTFFTEEVAKQLYVAYSSELNEVDKLRICDAYVTYGKSKWQWDNRELYIARVYMYEKSGDKPLVKYIKFYTSIGNIINEFEISDTIL